MGPPNGLRKDGLCIQWNKQKGTPSCASWLKDTRCLLPSSKVQSASKLKGTESRSIYTWGRSYAVRNCSVLGFPLTLPEVKGISTRLEIPN